MCPTYNSEKSSDSAQKQDNAALDNSSSSSLPVRLFEQENLTRSPVQMKNESKRMNDMDMNSMTGKLVGGEYSTSSLPSQTCFMQLDGYSQSSSDLIPGKSTVQKSSHLSDIKKIHCVKKSPNSSLSPDPLERFRLAYSNVLKRCKSNSIFLSENLSFLQDNQITVTETLLSRKETCIIDPYPHLVNTCNKTTGYLDQLCIISDTYPKYEHTKQKDQFPSLFPDLDWMMMDSGVISHKDKSEDRKYNDAIKRDLFWSHFCRPCLHSGAMFSGVQRSNNKQYDVMVNIIHVALQDSFVGGYLNIRGLTAEYPSLTTYFEAEIIGPKHGFITKKWDTDPDIDLRHWEMFSQFNYHKDAFVSGRPSSINPVESEYIFMRWKEQFLVPDHHITSINGASYDGFYYVCLDLSTQEIRGYYYYRCAKEWFEELVLKYNDNSQIGSYRFH